LKKPYDWRPLAHARLTGLVWQYGRVFTVIDEEFPASYAGIGVFALVKPKAFVVARYFLEDAESMLTTVESVAQKAFIDWRDDSLKRITPTPFAEN
jgi:hypothetical protein